MNRKYLFCTLVILTFFKPGWGQNFKIYQQRLEYGKQLFWQAKFDSAYNVLKNATLITPPGDQEAIFEAYLYLGFVVSRQDSPMTRIKSYLQQAIRIHPNKKINTALIPPDLVELFNNIRKQMVGCLYFITEPESVEMLEIQDENLIYTEISPAQLCGIINEDYEVLFSKKGYEEHIAKFRFRPGKIDTIHVTLPLVSTIKKGGSKWWAWVTGGSVVTATAILIKTVIGGGEKVESLPGPPDRPTPPGQ